MQCGDVRCRLEECFREMIDSELCESAIAMLESVIPITQCAAHESSDAVEPVFQRRYGKFMIDKG